ncbi:hypothetical protein M6B38_323380 [Iris pallida]|uniref:Uncharacterized protein n=1 Tax=Iris pallida TaxID=29817 RepID=A0AAX6HBF9_IRIPA|nr:hypothetical protein M6B38_323380 [Iris pallida]
MRKVGNSPRKRGKTSPEFGEARLSARRSGVTRAVTHRLLSLWGARSTNGGPGPALDSRLSTKVGSRLAAHRVERTGGSS